MSLRPSLLFLLPVHADAHVQVRRWTDRKAIRCFQGYFCFGTLSPCVSLRLCVCSSPSPSPSPSPQETRGPRRRLSCLLLVAPHGLLPSFLNPGLETALQELQRVLCSEQRHCHVTSPLSTFSRLCFFLSTFSGRFAINASSEFSRIVGLFCLYSRSRLTLVHTSYRNRMHVRHFTV
jgi:hypothetical protein